MIAIYMNTDGQNFIFSSIYLKYLIYNETFVFQFSLFLFLIKNSIELRRPAWQTDVEVKLLYYSNIPISMFRSKRILNVVVVNISDIYFVCGNNPLY